MSNIGWIIFGVVCLAVYTWNVIEIAANIAMSRIEQAFKDSMDNPDDAADIVNRLDRMWGKADD